MICILPFREKEIKKRKLSPNSNEHFQNALTFIQQSEGLSSDEKNAISKAVKEVAMN